MKAGGGKDVQLSFEFNRGEKIKFYEVTAQCRCGYSEVFKKADIVLEMTVLCPKCGSTISVKQ